MEQCSVVLFCFFGETDDLMMFKINHDVFISFEFGQHFFFYFFLIQSFFTLFESIFNFNEMINNTKIYAIEIGLCISVCKNASYYYCLFNWPWMKSETSSHFILTDCWRNKFKQKAKEKKKKKMRWFQQPN